MAPVKVMKYNHVFDAVISADAKGIIEYWSPVTFEFPENEYISFFKKNYFIDVVCLLI